jgi:hypothetical protein
MTIYVEQRSQLLIDNAWKYLSYPLMEAKIFILSCNVGINKYKLQLFRLSIWMHLVISSCLLHLEPLWTNERHLHLRLNLFFYEWNVNKLSNSLYKSTFQHYEAFRYFGLREMIFSWKICKVVMKTRVHTHKFDIYFILNHQYWFWLSDWEASQYHMNTYLQIEDDSNTL